VELCGCCGSDDCVERLMMEREFGLSSMRETVSIESLCLFWNALANHSRILLYACGLRPLVQLDLKVQGSSCMIC
jgi:hypothetical protein